VAEVALNEKYCRCRRRRRRQNRRKICASSCDPGTTESVSTSFQGNINNLNKQFEFINIIFVNYLKNILGFETFSNIIILYEYHNRI